MPVLTLLLCVAALSVRVPATVSGVSPVRFWCDKYALPPQFDMVLAGCSRVYRGLSPQAMRQVLPEYRIANYAFASVGYSQRYLDAVAHLLAPGSPRRTIVLGIQPVNLMRKHALSNGFTATADTSAADRWLVRHCTRLAGFIAPYDATDLREIVKGSHAKYYEVYWPDGWVASHKVPENPTEALPVYREIYDDAQASTEVTDLVLRTVRSWRADGIAVIGVRVPTSQAMRDLEQQVSSFDEPSFARRFRAAGGIYLSLPLNKYHSYDGSHLRDDAAVVFSRDVAWAIRASERLSRPAPAPAAPRLTPTQGAAALGASGP